MTKKQNQASVNPFAYSDSNKRYYTYDYWAKTAFGGKCVKIPLDAGMTCPNIDGRCGRGGCIYCSGRGSGDMAPTSDVPLAEQYRIGREKLSSKWDTSRCIPYFQAHTNTYAPLERLTDIFTEALSFDGVVGMNIATRADCLLPPTVDLLASLAEKTCLTVELGLQTVHDGTAARINRGHTYADFLAGYRALRQASDRIRISVHIIFGLPGEDREHMEQTVRQVARLRPDAVKIHLLYVLRQTPLGRMYESGAYVPLERGAYIDTVVRALELLPPDTVIGRLTGDAPAADLLAPEWSRKKVSVLNDIDKQMFLMDTYQGRLFEAD